MRIFFGLFVGDLTWAGEWWRKLQCQRCYSGVGGNRRGTSILLSKKQSQKWVEKSRPWYFLVVGGTCTILYPNKKLSGFSRAEKNNMSVLSRNQPFSLVARRKSLIAWLDSWFWITTSSNALPNKCVAWWFWGEPASNVVWPSGFGNEFMSFATRIQQVSTRKYPVNSHG